MYGALHQVLRDTSTIRQGYVIDPPPRGKRALLPCMSTVIKAYRLSGRKVFLTYAIKSVGIIEAEQHNVETE